MNKVRILSLGLSQSNFLVPLYDEIRKIDDSFSFSIDNFYDLSKGVIDEKKNVFDNFYDFSKYKFSKTNLIKSFFTLLFKRYFYEFLIFELKKNKSLKEIIKFLKNQIINKTIVEKNISTLEFDIFHFHFCTPNFLKYLHHLPKKSKIICSFWGSDLFRFNSSNDLFYVTKALKRATKITIQTPEMGKELLKKYGVKFESKLSYARFALEKEIYNFIEIFKDRKEFLDLFKAKLKIPLEEKQTIIAIGYNAFKESNHISVLEAINNLPESIKKNITCILMLTYGRKEAYLDELDMHIEKMSHFQIVKIENFLIHEDLAKLRLITDIQIQVPSSDALSGSVTEIISTGNLLLTGSWLPYQIYNRLGLKYHQINRIDEITEVLPKMINDKEKLKLINLNNHQVINKYFFPDYTSKSWISIYNKFYE